MRTFFITATLALFAVFTFVTVTDAQQYPHSFTAHTQSVGPLELKIDPVPIINQTNTKQTLTYHLTNSSDKPIECQMTYSSTDTIRVEQSPVTITVPAKGTADGSLEFVVWTGAINGYYPIRVKATFVDEARNEKRDNSLSQLATRNSQLTLESVRVIETRLPNPARFTPIVRPVPAQPVSTADQNQESQYQFTLNEGFVVTIYPGSMGLLDSKIVFTNPNDEKSSITYYGVNISIKGKSLESGWTFTKQPKLTMDKVNNRLEFSTEVINNNRPEPILAYVYVTNGILIFDFPETNPEHIDQIRFKSTDKVASRFFFGHGYVLNDPQRFSRGNGGHQLAASHVGFEFENGPAIVMSTPDCPERCELDKGRKIYTLECTGRARLELIPSAKGAYAAAVAFRQNDPFHIAPSPGAIRKRGMMLYDLWPGTYEENQKLIEKVAAYGVTNAMVCKHIWQHWGYDIHLPDIWNINADNPIFAPLGTYEQLVKLSERCRELGFSFGVHDNYIDIYPDCTDFSYNRVAFHEDGTPQRAWYNPDFEAQSYRSRPDTLSIPHNKNMALDKKLLPCVDNVFIDVFTAIAPYNYYDINGNFHHKLETRQCWRNLYENTEKALSYTDKDGKVQSGIAFSESGGDHLIGSLAGGDCALEWNFVESPCALWNYSPWYAAVNHSNFARHGAGFPARFNNRGHWSLRNQLSDDYLCCEVLAGVDMMVSTEYIYPGSIRNYYLLEHLMMRLADKEIMNVEFVNDEIQLQTVTWSDGTKVTTNRCPSDRVVSGYTIPVCGYIALDKDGNLLSGIYRNVPKQKAKDELVRSEELGVRSDAKRSSEVDGSKEFTQSCGSTTTPHSSLLTPHSSLLTPNSSLLTPHS